MISEDPDITSVNPKIPIVKLAPGQKIRFEAIAKLGIGQEHAKWQSVSACTYRHVPIVDLDSEKCKSCEDCVDVCPKKVFEKEKNKILIANPNSCILCMDCVKTCSKEPSLIKINSEKNSFIFYVESTGSLPVEVILNKALKIYSEKCFEIINKIKVI
jgi:DNA-directed RNA polymerase subunit D